MPLISFPYLIRVLGIENFGLMVFIQSIILYLNKFVDFGFTYSATREIALHRDNTEKVNEIFSSVLVIKFVLIVFTFIVLCILTTFFYKFSADATLYFLTFLMILGEALFPIWLFQGLEKMKYITYINISSKVIFTIAIFIFVNNRNDLDIALLLYSLGYLTSGFFGIYFAKKYFNIEFFIPSLEKTIFYFKDSSNFFFARIAGTIYGSGNTLVLGLSFGNEMVGYYAIAEKLSSVLARIYQPISNTLYPYIAKEQNISLYKKIFSKTIIFHFILYIVLYYYTENIIILISGTKPILSIISFHILLTASLFVIPSILLTYPFLAALGYKKEANLSSIYAVYFYLFGMTCLYFTSYINIMSVSFLLLFTEMLVLVLLVYYIHKFKLWKL